MATDDPDRTAELRWTSVPDPPRHPDPLPPRPERAREPWPEAVMFCTFLVCLTVIISQLI